MRYSSGPRLSEQEFSLFQRLIYDQAGIDLGPQKKMMIEARLCGRLGHWGFETYGAYFEFIRCGSDPNEMQVVIDLLTTNETFFFREPEHFEMLKSQVLPAVQSTPVRVWSAACSSGEETYSLAMILAETLPPGGWDLIGSDISRRVLQKAQAGHYLMQRHEGISGEYLRKYCLRGTGSQDGTLLISSKLRQRVRFCQVNLNESLPNIGHFDVIFLRNVLIYFDQQTKAAIVGRIARQLKPGGHLFISHTENLHGIEVGLEMLKPSVFRKTG